MVELEMFYQVELLITGVDYRGTKWLSYVELDGTCDVLRYFEPNKI